MCYTGGGVIIGSRAASPGAPHAGVGIAAPLPSYSLMYAHPAIGTHAPCVTAGFATPLPASTVTVAFANVGAGSVISVPVGVYDGNSAADTITGAGVGDNTI